MSAGPKVILIEDDPRIRRFVRVALESHGFRLVEAETAREGILHSASDQPDLILLDLGLPDADGLELIRQVREWSNLPIIVLSARGQERDKVAALDAGADDYLTKPFGIDELLARMRAALRRASLPPEGSVEPVLTVGDLQIDFVRRQVKARGAEVRLTPTEYRLLGVLARHAGKVLTHGQLLREVWGPGSAEETQYLRVYMGQLRRKIEADTARPRYLFTEPGVGYRLAAE